MSDQRTDEWFTERLGKVTASRVHEILPGAKGGYLASRKNYMAELLCDRLAIDKRERFMSHAMHIGEETEPLARGEYEFRTGNMVREVGFIPHPTIENFGASPDGIVDGVCGLEIKCPNTATHLDTLINGTVEPKYITQMHVGMMCVNIPSWDFVSYDPRLPNKLSYYCKTFQVGSALIDIILKEVELFLAELDAMEEKMRGMM